MINTAPSSIPGMSSPGMARTSFGRGGMRPGPMNQQVGMQRPSMPRPITAPPMGPGMSVPPMLPPGSVGGPMRLGNPNAPTPDIGGINTSPSMPPPIQGPMNNQMNGPMGEMNNLWTNYNKLIGMGSSSMPVGY